MSEQQLKVYKSNDLMMAGYKLSVAENRLILTCIAKINRDPKAQVTDQVMYTVTAREFAELCGITMKVAYAELKQAVDAIFERKIMFANADRKRKTRWIQTADYLKNEGRIELRFATDILPYLVAIQSSYTTYNLRAVMRLSTFNSARLYEMVIMSKFTQRYTVLLNLDDIRFAMDIPDDQYPAYADFRKRVIEQAIKEVNRASDINIVSFRPKRDGKKIVAIEVRYEEKASFGLDHIQEDLLLESYSEQKPEKKAPVKRAPRLKAASSESKPVKASDKAQAITEQMISKHARPGESREEVILRLKTMMRAVEHEVA
jgi:plasmid replication initiation protein